MGRWEKCGVVRERRVGSKYPSREKVRLAEEGVGAPGVALGAGGRGDERPCTSSRPAGGGRGGGEVISMGRGLLTLENCSEVLAVTRISDC